MQMKSLSHIIIHVEVEFLTQHFREFAKEFQKCAKTTDKLVNLLYKIPSDINNKLIILFNNCLSDIGNIPDNPVDVIQIT